MLRNIVQKKKKTGLMGEMRLKAQHSIPKLNTVVNKKNNNNNLYEISYAGVFYTFSGGSVVEEPAQTQMH